jgi:small subunit ribosomal protein S6
MATQRQYETTYILVPDIDAADKDKVATRFKTIIEEQFGGELLRVDEWGRRQLAYPMRKQRFGHYVYNRFQATPEAIAEMERVLRLLDPVMKFLTVKLEKASDDTGARPKDGSSEPVIDMDDDDDDDDAND